MRRNNYRSHRFVWYRAGNETEGTVVWPYEASDFLSSDVPIYKIARILLLLLSSLHIIHRVILNILAHFSRERKTIMNDTKMTMKMRRGQKINPRTWILFGINDEKKLIARGATNLEWKLNIQWLSFTRTPSLTEVEETREAPFSALFG